MADTKKAKLNNIKTVVKIFRSNKAIYGQAVDQSGNVIASESSLKIKAKPTEAAFATGEKLAESIKSKKVDSIVFDRNGFRYHGRVKALAEGLRKGGIKF